MPDPLTTTGIVVIGRNLGPRLALCLASLKGSPCPVVYVDSASTDGSPEAAMAAGVTVVRLDPSEPMSASRGRNEGVASLSAHHPGLAFVQFVDGDCELHAGWLEHASMALAGRPTLGAVCGHLTEKHAARSIFARMLDLDWRGPVGEIPACGGIFMVRLIAFNAIGGFSLTMPAGEEAEFCARLRAAGNTVLRIDEPMCTHDADMHTLGPWWSRTARVGHTFAKSSRLTGPSADPNMSRRVRSVVLWAGLLPMLAVIGAAGTVLWIPLALIPLGVFGLYALQLVRLRAQRRAAGASPADANISAAFVLLAKFAQLQGCLRYWLKG